MSSDRREGVFGKLWICYDDRQAELLSFPASDVQLVC